MCLLCVTMKQRTDLQSVSSSGLVLAEVLWSLKVTGCASRSPPAMSRSPKIKMARWPKTPVELEKCIGAESVRTIGRE